LSQEARSAHLREQVLASVRMQASRRRAIGLATTSVLARRSNGDSIVALVGGVQRRVRRDIDHRSLEVAKGGGDFVQPLASMSMQASSSRHIT
jgi:hypothetical protein